MPSFQSTPLIGLPRFDGWSQVMSVARGLGTCVFAISGPNASNVGRDVVEEIENRSIESAADLHGLITDLLQNVRDKGCGLQLVACLIHETGEGATFFAINGSLLLKRDLKVGIILQSGGELKVVEGRLKSDDVMVLATEQGNLYLSEIQQKLEKGFEVDSIITTLVPILHGSDDSALSALAFIVERKLDSSFITAEPETEPVIDFSFVAQDDEPDPEVADFAADVEATEVEEYALEIDDQELTTAQPLESTPQSFANNKLGTSPSRKTTQVAQSISRFFSSLKQAPTSLIGMAQKLRSDMPFASGSDVYVTRSNPKRIMRIILPVILAVGLVAGITIYFTSKRSQQVMAAQAAVAPVRQQLQEAKDLVATNPLAARDKVSGAIDELKRVSETFAGQTAALKKVNEVTLEAQTIYQDISGKQEVSQLPIFYDLSLAQPTATDFVAVLAKNLEDRALFVDADKGQVLTLDPTNKQVSLQSLGDQPKVVDMALEGDNLWLLGGGLRRFPLEGTGSAAVVKEDSDVLKDSKFIAPFGRFLYILNPEKRMIYRLAPSSDGYTDPVGWLRSSQGLDLTLVSSMAIDGDIWLTTREGELRKFTTGREAEFEVKGLSDGFSTNILVVTREDLDNLYVLEPAKQRLVVLNKQGEFIKEVKSGSLASATTLIVDETKQKAWPVSGSILFEVDLSL